MTLEELAAILDAGRRATPRDSTGFGFVLTRALDAMAREARKLASLNPPEPVSGRPASPTDDTGGPVRPAECANCGGPGKALEWDPVDGWSCPQCGASDADETGG